MRIIDAGRAFRVYWIPRTEHAIAYSPKTKLSASLGRFESPQAAQASILIWIIELQADGLLHIDPDDLNAVDEYARVMGELNGAPKRWQNEAKEKPPEKTALTTMPAPKKSSAS